MERIASSAQELNSQFHLSCSSGFVLGGDGAHGLYLSDDSGDSWRKLETPFTGQLVIALAISPFFSEDHTLLVCAAGEGDRVVQLWISQDEGLSWSLRHSREADRFSARIAVSGKDASNAVLGLGEWVLYNDSEGWKTSVIATQSAPVSAVEVLPDSNIIVAATTDQVQYLTPAGSWAASDSLRDQAVVALVRSPTFNQDRTLYALRSDGMLIKGIFNLS
jgi:WD40 repeat protein